MESVAILLEHYRQELDRAVAFAPAQEQHLCSLLLQELAALETAIAANDQSAISTHITHQQQLFGRSFLSGQAGESAESAFNRVARVLGRVAT